MRIGDKNYELIWPGWFEATPAIIVFIVLPCALTYALLRYSSFSKLKKIILIPFCFLTPFLIFSLIPFVLVWSGFIAVTDSTLFEAYQSVSMLFGDYSRYVWCLPTSFICYAIFNGLKKRSPHTTHFGTASKGN